MLLVYPEMSCISAIYEGTISQFKLQGLHVMSRPWGSDQMG